MDGVNIPAVTHWFYGISYLIPGEKNRTMNKTKQLSRADLECFDDVYRLGQSFIESASSLPFLPKKEFAKEAKRFEQEFAKAKEKIGKTQLPFSEDSLVTPHNRVSEGGHVDELDAS